MGKGFFRVLCLLAALFTLAACSDTVSPDLETAIRVDETSISLEGNVGDTLTDSFTVSNSDPRGRPERYQVSESASWLRVTSGASGTIKRNQTATVRLSATCSSAGTFPTNLSISSNRTAPVTVSVTLSCEGDTEPPPPPPPPPSGSEFEITLIFSGSITDAQKDVFRQAAAKWSTILVGDIPDTRLIKPSNSCGPAFDGTVDDVVIYASVEPIDGAGSVLGSAGPCYVRSGSKLPLYGIMRFDSADVDSLGSRFEAVILHEMGHVLGIGTIWDDLNLLAFNGSSCLNSSSIGFTGSSARAEYADLGGSGNVPVENGGGSGTKCSHWDEETFDNELMTGFLGGNTSGNPLSRLTAGSMIDLGYGVDLTAADSYTIPNCSPACLRAHGADKGIHIAEHEILLSPIGVVSPDGKITSFDQE